ncbi:hypothetical protein [Puniceicoccus vermicola]|uniref:Alpha-galactosidase n=1 Tax=Puniceicoccus vermicola TaxID=388746 RepID=A0A7X1AYW8_9BACT|nr:hypothetical protein [Puniceicoccus vermicola]MBC2602530.1 hypothetical protein [Puniceicoccus vermicola]
MSEIKMEIKEKPISRIEFDNTSIELVTHKGCLRSIGAVTVNGTHLRNAQVPFLPWFDSYQGEVFDRFMLLSVAQDGDVTRVELQTESNSDFPFRERRDCSGDLCFRNRSFDAPPLSVKLAICFKPAAAEIGRRVFSGFTYWFEYTGEACPIHRLLDRGSWELGGNLDDVNLVCRNWLTPPRMRIARETTYSTVGLDNWANLLPGNMWARWSLLPGFDMQYGQEGILVGWFDQVSLVRTTLESNTGEDAIRINDFHWFEQSGQISTNPKTILHCPDILEHTAALNLWTELQDRDREMSQRQFGIPEEEPPRLTLSENVWSGFNFDTTYEHVLETAAEFGMDQIFVDVCWEQGEALKESLAAVVPLEKQKGTIFEKYQHRNMCCVLDFKVAAAHGGEAALKRLCDRASGKGVKVISWMAAHVHPHSVIVDGPQCLEDAHADVPSREHFKHGMNGAIAGQESGRHPWTGYPNSCWTLNLNSPVYDYLCENLLGVCERTGLSGYLWDSYSNLGWWQVDYSDGSMRPQFDRMAGLYAEMARRGLYVKPEALVAFSSHSCCGLHGGNVYAGDLLGYSYDTTIDLNNTGISNEALLSGEVSPELVFRCFAHRRVPSLRLHQVPRDKWNETSVATMKKYFAMYKAARGIMKRRTVLADDAGVLWEGDQGEQLLWSFIEGTWTEGQPVELLTGRSTEERRLEPWRVYRIEAI